MKHSSNSIKLDDELRWEIKKISIFGKKTLIRIHKIKNHSIWISIYGEINEQNQNRKINHVERKFDKISKN